MRRIFTLLLGFCLIAGLLETHHQPARPTSQSAGRSPWLVRFRIRWDAPWPGLRSACRAPMARSWPRPGATRKAAFHLIELFPVPMP